MASPPKQLTQIPGANPQSLGPFGDPGTVTREQESACGTEFLFICDTVGGDRTMGLHGSYPLLLVISYEYASGIIAESQERKIFRGGVSFEQKTFALRIRMCYSSAMKEPLRVPRKRQQPGFGRFLRKRRMVHRLTQGELGALIGVPQRTISAYEQTDTVLSSEQLDQLAQALGEDTAAWRHAAGYEENPLPSPRVSEVSGEYVPRPSDSRLPVAGVLRAGEVTMATEEYAEYFPCLAEHAALADYVVRIEGWSMTPKLEPGDFVAVRKGVLPVSGDIVVARRGEDTFVKRFVRRTREGVLLRSDNPEYGELQGDDIEILGVVVWKHSTQESLRQRM